ncbi:MAG TPA: TIGR03067 domain-containing protein, partial [Gemmataceae bacterium]|nr:TIGR03067 domain-containing protein [Gemmataceae bacterium]
AGLFSEMKMIFDGNNLTVMVDKTNKERSRFTLVEGMQPPGIDIEESRGNGKQIIKGIYQLEDDTLRICMEEGNGGTGIRPKSFETKGNDHVILVVLKRVQK